MYSHKLSDRIASYQEAADYKLLPKIPIIININGKRFSKLTSLIEKPYDVKFAECMFSTMLRLCSEIEGAVFSYHHNDEIVLILRNDQTVETTAWLDNKIQKICSITSSLATLHFNQCATTVNLNLLGTPLFISNIFAVPTIAEAINTIVYKQQHNFLTSIEFSCFYELLKKYDKNVIKEMLLGLSVDEKINLLNQEANVKFTDYSLTFRRGAACYKIPKENNMMKSKWIINSELPIFTRDQSFLSNILKNGCDIFYKDENNF